LGFRFWSTSDLELALGLWGDPAVTLLIDARGQLSREEVKQRLEQELVSAESHNIQYWPIFVLENDEHIGCCGLRPYDLARQIYEIGFHIRSQHWGNGYATEAAQRVIAYAFDVLDAQGLFAGHNPRNTASCHILLKLGFSYTHDEFYEPTGLNHPSYMLTADEYAYNNP
jgi:RimJ/RimL family protein N-acetyltransferase